ncbi:hypothetical protein PENDEC_c004G00793 [Penicillium decumbens]|uniref:CFEM domain-containing protein n=1 Tax=Penicillium decumbens TaxID=69771 RepID=A0A1V6PJK0_PENDC|nr:hypothetical protein PENDEC_c004G00793 [Penicillium decumbens]
MQFSTALIALVAAGLANAQLPNVPACSLNCFVSALTSDGCSTLTDFACHCQKPALVSTITPCVQKACPVADQISVSSVVVAQCSSAGHPISVPSIEPTTAAGTTTTESSSTPAETSATATATETGNTSTSTSTVESFSASATGSSSSSASMTATSSSPVGSSSASAGGSGSTPGGTSTPLVTQTGSSSAATTSPAFNGAVGIKGNMACAAAIAAAAAAAYVL